MGRTAWTITLALCALGLGCGDDADGSAGSAAATAGTGGATAGAGAAAGAAGATAGVAGGVAGNTTAGVGGAMAGVGGATAGMGGAAAGAGGETAGSGAAGAGGDGAGCAEGMVGMSGLGSACTLGSLSAPQSQQLCDWARNLPGVGVEMPCDGGFTVVVEVDSQCQPDKFAGCAATVAEAEACFTDNLARPCELILDSCFPLLACAAN